MALYNGKTTTTMLLLWSDPYSVDGETSGFGTAILHFREFLKRKLSFNEVHFSIQKSASGWLNG